MAPPGHRQSHGRQKERKSMAIQRSEAEALVGKYRRLNHDRIDFSKVSGALALPNLCEIQLNSFQWFLDKGVDEILTDFFPVSSIDPKLKQEESEQGGKEIRLDYVRGSAKWTEVKPAEPFEAKEKNLTYARKLNVEMTLELPTGEVIKKPVFMGEYPMMTDSGTFIINGSERCIVSQIVRSPGAYISKDQDKAGGKYVYGGDIIPQRGTWVEFLSDAKDTLSVRIDKQRKVSAITLLRALGLNDDSVVLSLFGNANAALNNTLRKSPAPSASDPLQITKQACKDIYSKLRPGEPISEDPSVNLIRNHFFEKKHYDLGKAGRFKLGMKLGVYNRLADKVLAEPLVSSDGEIVFEAGHKMTRGDVEKLRSLNFFEKGAMQYDPEESDCFFHVFKRLDDHGKIQLVKVFQEIGEDSDFAGNIALSSPLTKGEDGYVVQSDEGVSWNSADAKREFDETKRYVLSLQPDAEGIVQTVESNPFSKLNQGPKGEFKGSRFKSRQRCRFSWDSFEMGKKNDPDVQNFLKTHCVVNIVGSDLTLDESHVTISDIFAVFSYFLDVMQGVGTEDDIDNLSNRRVKCVGELIQNYFRQGLSRMEKSIRDRMGTLSSGDGAAKTLDPNNVLNIKPLTSIVSEFFNSSQLSQFMDQTNPLAELSNKRRLSALGPGGISRDRASFEVRDIHFTHYGRICPIETPEGQNVGLINNLACYAKIDDHGFITTPYRRVVKGKVTEQTAYLSADEEQNQVIAEANTEMLPDGTIKGETVTARRNGDTIHAKKEDVNFIDVSPKQIVSIAAASIPFLENDDTNRAQLACNMQRQALPLLKPRAPIIGTGMENKIAHDSGSAVVCKHPGTVLYADSVKIIVKEKDGTKRLYKLRKFAKANQATCINQTPIVKIGDEVKADQIIADGPAMDQGDLALGQNETIAFMTWHGYDYEDAVVMSENCRREDTFTSIHIDEYAIDLRKTKLGNESFTRDVPNIAEDSKSHLDERGIVIPGTVVREGDILVGKITPKGETQLSPEEKLLQSIFSDKAKEGKDTSLRVPHGGAGIVQDVKVFKRANGDEMPPNVLETVKVYIIQKRKISEGDKMSGRHGNKGVISKLVPVEDMPFLSDGTPVDMCLNPLGVPSRMNIGQILETHLGQACRKLGLRVATPVFDGVSNAELFSLMEAAGESKDGKAVVYDGQTGERFDNRIAVGCMYLIKLDHMVDDKVHARATGPYSLVTQQPLGGKAQNGGQRFGEMEVWALEAYGASHTLQEMLTIKSDDMVGRNKTYEAILKGRPIPRPSMPESFRVMLKELQGLAINVSLLDRENKPIDMDSITSDNAKEARKIAHEIRNFSLDDEEEYQRRQQRLSADLRDEDPAGGIGRETSDAVSPADLRDALSYASDSTDGEKED